MSQSAIAPQDGAWPNPQHSETEPTPDTPLTSLWKLAFGLVNTAILIGLFVLVGYYFYLNMFPRDLYRECVVTIVAERLVAPEAPVSGRCYALKPLQHGDRVREGERLAVIESEELTVGINTKRQKLQKLHQRKLMLDDNSTNYDLSSTDLALEHEFRQVAHAITELEIALEADLLKAKKLTVLSPVDGRIHYGLAASQTIKAHQPITHIYPDGGRLLVEVEGPMKLINELIVQDRVVAVISAPGRSINVIARPNASSLRSSLKHHHNGGPSGEIWGVIQCVPESIPVAAQSPGLVGQLASTTF